MEWYKAVSHSARDVFLIIAEFDLAGIRAHQKAGFRKLGRRRKCWLAAGRAFDEAHVDCLALECEATRSRRDSSGAARAGSS